MKKRIIIIIIAFLAMASDVKADVEVNAQNFPDPVFRKWVLDHCSENGILTDYVINNVTTLSLGGGIVDLTGIKFFTRLMYLTCSGNKLKSLDVSGMTSLMRLSCSNNDLYSLNVSGCTDLLSLNCNDNNLVSLNLSGIKFLDELYCEGNQLTSLDLHDCTYLRTLACPGNQISTLFLYGCSKLLDIWCSDNNLSTLDVSGLSNLKYLSCGNNQLSNITLTGCTALERLSCGDNQLSSLDISDCPTLKSLFCHNNNFQTINFNSQTLGELWCYGNGITSMDFSNCPNIGIIYCYNNKIGVEAMEKMVESLPWNSVKAKGRIYIIDTSNENERNVVSTDQVAILKDKYWRVTDMNGEVDYSGVEIGLEINSQNFPDENFRNYLLNTDQGKSGVLTKKEIETITSIRVSDRNISSLAGIKYFTSLQTLYCSGNKLKSLDVSDITTLTYLSCQSNQLTNLNIQGCVSLNELYCNGNQLSRIDLPRQNAGGAIRVRSAMAGMQENATLTSLYCGGNLLTTLDLSDMTSLKYLSCEENQLTNLDIQGCESLEQLDCGNNLLTTLDVSDNVALKAINCSINKISSLNLTGLTNLEGLYCYSNMIGEKAMGTLIESLPKSTEAWIVPIDTNNAQEGNVVTTDHVASAIAKGWHVFDYKGGELVEYKITTDINSPLINSNQQPTDSNWFTLDGRRLNNIPNTKGLYIHKNKKILIK